MASLERNLNEIFSLFHEDPKEERKYIRMALAYLHLKVEDIDESNLDLLIDTAYDLRLDAVISRTSPHAYFTEAKSIPYDNFMRAIKMYFDGVTYREIEKSTGVNHTGLVKFSHWWKKHGDKYDLEHDPRGVYHAFLQRNIAYGEPESRFLRSIRS